MRSLGQKVVLVTGGAAGIGKAVATQFAGDGARLILTDINAAALDATAAELRAKGVTVNTYVLDVTDAPGILAVRDRIHAEVGPVDGLVNNAGTVFGGPFLDVGLERHLLTYRINVFGLVGMTHAFLPDLIGRTDAHLVNVASASGYIGLPFGSTYASSKWAVIGFSESVRLELKLLGHTHVHVTTVCPSYVSTGLFEGAKAPVTTRLLTPDRLAAKIRRAVLSNRIYVNTPWLVKVTPICKGLLPTRAFDAVSWMLGATKSMMQWRGHSTAKPDKPVAPTR